LCKGSKEVVRQKNGRRTMRRGISGAEKLRLEGKQNSGFGEKVMYSPFTIKPGDKLEKKTVYTRG